LFFCQPLFGGKHYQTSLFPSYFGPLADSQDVLNAIVEAIVERTQQVESAEILSPTPLPASAHLPFVENLDNTYRLALNVGLDAIFAKFDRNFKRILRRPMLPGMELIVDLDGALLDEFYKVYVDVYTGKHGFIPHEKRLYANIFARYPKGTARIYAVKINGKYTGATFTIWAHGEVYYAWSAVKPNSTFHPTHYVIWQLIKDGMAEGYACLNLGESEKDNHGLNHFKTDWGAEVSEPCRYFVPGKAPHPTPRLYDRFSWTKTVISHLPAMITTNTLSRAIRFFL
jgi:lipid II:glycine glycyltransferase (peptidoglycan interpeptide bridge formation enzyme)